MIFGENLLALMVLALGGALAAGNLLALIRPRVPKDDDTDDLLEQAPLGRSLAMIAFGLVAAIWALASLISGGDEEPAETSTAPVATITDATPTPPA